MSDIKLFRINGNWAKEIQGTASQLEKPLQNLIEENLQTLLGIRFLAGEYPTGKTNAGCIDTLGLDENGSPVIIEYKRFSHENIINQGLFYLDWLMDRQAEFKLLVLEKFGQTLADSIDWSTPRLVCIAADFTKYDRHAVQQIDRNIELLRYRQFDKELLLLEVVHAVAAESTPAKKSEANRNGGPEKAFAGRLTAPSSGMHNGPEKAFAERLADLAPRGHAGPEKTIGERLADPSPRLHTGPEKTVAERLADPSPRITEILSELESYFRSLGDDVQRKDTKLYIAFKRLRNFASVVLKDSFVLLYLHLDPDKHPHVERFTRDVRHIGHWGTGDLELVINHLPDLEKAKPYLQAAYLGENS